MVPPTPTSLPFLFSLILSLCLLLRLSFYLKLSGRNCFFLLSSHKGFPGHSFLPGTTRLISWPDRGALLVPSAIPCSLSFTSRNHSCLFPDWRRTVSSKFFDTRVSSVSTEELVLHRHARCVLSRLHCNEHSLLLSFYFTRIGRIENLSCSACGHLSFHSALSSYGLLAPFTLWQFSVFYDLWWRPCGVVRLLGLHGLRPCFHPSKGAE